MPPEDPKPPLPPLLPGHGDTPEGLLAEAERLEAEAWELKARAGRLEWLAKRRRQDAQALREGDLNIGVESGTVNAMNASANLTPNAQRSATRIVYKDVRFVLAMKENGEAGKPGATVSEVAAILTKHFKKNFHVNTVQAWYVPVEGKAHRDCPLAVREYLREFYGKYTSGDHRGAYRVPLDSWPLKTAAK